LNGYITNKVTDANGNETETVFDAAGRKTMDIAVGKTASDMVKQYTYDKSRISTVTPNDNTLERHYYDNLGRVIR